MDCGTQNVAGRLTIRELLRRHKKSLAIALVAVLGAGIANLLQPWPLKIVFDVVDGSRPLHGWLKHLVHVDLGLHRSATIEFAALAVIAIAAFGALCSYVEAYMTSSVGQWLTHDLRLMLYNHLQHLSLTFHNHKQTGDLIGRLTTDIDAVQTFVVSGLVGFVTDSITLLGMAGVMLYLNWRFTLVALSAAPILFTLTYSFTRRSKKASREVRKKQSEIVSLMQENLSAIGILKAFSREEYEQHRLDEGSRETVNMALRARALKAKLSPLVDIVVAIGTALVLLFGGKLVLAGGLSAGSLIVFIWYLGKMYKPMQDFAKLADTYSKAAVGYERIHEVLDAVPEVVDVPLARPAPSFTGEVTFETVNFSYTAGQPVLSDISFNIEAGQTAALVGPTGAGKTTIAALIARLYDPDSGMVKIDGRNVQEYQQKSLREQISVVQQENILFHTTIWENIAYGKPEATHKEILRAAELADVDEFISKMPAGYDTVVGERGVTLSGGQRQRIAIARAIIRDTPILILDEPSSGLDAVSEQMVFRALERLMKDKTTLVIAHRLATVQRADRIMVVNQGRIVESGKHDQLLKNAGLYAALYEIQFFPQEPKLRSALPEVCNAYTSSRQHS
jgi:ATP-binding cassette, subfamily B, bacterial